MIGRVIKSTGSWYRVMDTEGGIHDCKLRGKIKLEGRRVTNPIAVGDRVDFTPGTDEHAAVINEILPRDNYIIRKAVKKSAHSHILASNIDLAMLIVTFSRPRTSIGFIDRFLITAESYRIPAVLVFNKKDEMSEEELEEFGVIKSIYEPLGYKTLLISALEEEGVGLVGNEINGKTTLFAGHSGVGKSTLLNALDPRINQETKEVSSFANKGVHTTTFAEMFPLSPDTFIIDTPGIKEFGLAEVEDEELGHFFPEMREYLGQCKFHNCRHIDEPGCLIKDLVDSGEISFSRYNSYLSILLGEDNRK